MQSCKGIVQSGSRKGQVCISTKSIDSDGYCNKHQRYKEYVKRTEAGQKVCSQYFRGCNAICDEVSSTCNECKAKKYGQGRNYCAHESCKNYAEMNTKYCGKHKRDTYRDYEKEHRVRFCNIERGCFLLCEGDEVCCKSCMIKHYLTNHKYFRADVQYKTCIHCESSLSSDEIERTIKHCITCTQLFLKNFHLHSANIQKDNMTFKLENPEKHYKTIQKSAEERGLPFELSLDSFSRLIQSDCYYCKRLNAIGIDRMDNKIGYTIENSVPCCFPCNRMKHTLTTEAFINKCYAIYNYYTHSKSFGNALHSLFPCFISKANESYIEYKTKASKRHEFELTPEEYEALRKGICYLCGTFNTQSHNNGIDRKHNEIGYILSNSNTCCGSCNLLKANIPIGIVKDCISKIVNNPHLHCYVAIKDMLQVNCIQIPFSVRSIISTKSFAQTIENIIPKSTSSISVPKQWKTRDIFDFLEANQEHYYKAYCEANNDLSTIDWSTLWSEFLNIKGQSWTAAEPLIRTFVENLRRIRHNALTKKDVLNREDRQVWPAETVAKLFAEGRIHEYKVITEQYAGDKPEDPAWQKRWEQFVGNLESANMDDRVGIISKFMTAQRTKKYRRSK